MNTILNDEEKVELLKKMFFACQPGTNGFEAKRFRADHYEHRDKIDQLEKAHFIESSEGRIYKLGLIALAELEKSIPECKVIIDVCELIFRYLKAEYLQEPEQTLFLINIGHRYNVDHRLISMATPYLLQANIFSSYSINGPAGVCVTTREEILDYESFRQCIERLQGYSVDAQKRFSAQENRSPATYTTLSRSGNLPDIQPLLHPAIFQHAYLHYQNGHFREAVLNSIMVLFDMIRNKTNLEDDGDKLVGKAFSHENPYLKINDLDTESGRNDQAGFMQMLKGAYQGIRNPKAHSLNHDLNELKTVQYLVFASLMARRIDEAEVVQTNQKNVA